MIKTLILLLYHLSTSVCRQYYITFNRFSCKLDQSDCDGSKDRPFSNPIIAFKKAIFFEVLENTGSLEFFFEAGGHTILPMDFLGDNMDVHRKSPFETYNGRFFFIYYLLFIIIHFFLSSS
jgi:hypothetical protein